ncbi:MAG: hypothetical protein FJ098_14365, partial [Deltaproteobacteria bacterium]|nr:hypothetical protein [Deltaproteobacteria bacterium]
ALRRDFEACLDREPPRDRVCVAAALGRADFCAWPEHPAREKACRVVVAAAAAIRAADPLVCAGVGAPFLRRLCERAVRGEPDRRIHCPPEDPACPILTAVSLSACRSWWWAASSFPMGRALCAWTEILEALRRDPARGCAGVPDALRPLCAAVAAQDPEACPPPISTSVPPVVLSGRCRNAVVPGRDLDAMQAPYGNGLILSFPLRNAFERAATCRVTAALSAGGRVLVRGTSEPVALPASGGPRPSMLSILRFRMAPAPAGLDLSWDVDCSWPHEEGFLRPRRDGVRVVH